MGQLRPIYACILDFYSAYTTSWWGPTRFTRSHH